MLELGLRNNEILQEVKTQCRFKTDAIKCVGRKLILRSIVIQIIHPFSRKTVYSKSETAAYATKAGKLLTN